jgi:hypothetical protein
VWPLEKTLVNENRAACEEMTPRPRRPGLTLASTLFFGCNGCWSTMVPLHPIVALQHSPTTPCQVYSFEQMKPLFF